MKVRIVAGLVAVFLGVFASATARAADDADAFRQEALAQLNAFRAEQGRGPVTLDPALDGIASEWAAKLAREGELEHRSRGNLKSLLDAHGWRAMNENLYMSSTPSSSPGEVIAAWKGSSGHRRNLLQEDITRIGLGAASGPSGFFVVFNGAG